MPLVVVGHGSGAALLQGQARLGAIKRLDLALLVDREHDRVRRRIDIKPDHVAELRDELRIIGELELPHSVRLKAVSAPDALDGADGDRRMISTVPRSSAVKSTISARQACFCAALRSLTKPSRRWRSDSETAMEIPVRMHQTRTPQSQRESLAGLARQTLSTSDLGPMAMPAPATAVCKLK